MNNDKVTHIYSHPAPRHLDDTLALLVAKQKFPDAKVDFIHPQDAKLNELKNDKTKILLDVGMDYNPLKHNYDHHHDLSLPASITLALKHIAPDEYSKLSDEAKYFINGVSIRDTKGPHEAEKHGFSSHPSTAHHVQLFNTIVHEELKNGKKVSDILTTNFTDAINKAASTPISEVRKQYKHVKQFDELLKQHLDEHVPDKAANYYERTSLNLLSIIKPEIAQKYMHKYIQNEKQNYDAVKNAKVIKAGQHKILISDTPLQVKHVKKLHPDWTFIISRNQFNPQHTSVIKNTASPHTQNIDIENIYSYIPRDKKVFTHKTGFITVFSEPLEKLDITQLIKSLFNNK